MIDYLGRRLEALPPGTIPQWALRCMIVLALAVVVLDFVDPHQTAINPPPPPEERVITLNRPVEGDQHRPFDHRQVPRAPGAEEPMLPNGEPLVARPAGRRMRFELMAPGARLPVLIVANGDIERGVTGELEWFDLKHAKRAVGVVLFSPGGSVVEALALGDYIRERGLATLVLDEHLCASSCPVVFASGVKRIAGTGAWIGVHQIYIGNPLKPGTDVHREIADIQDLTGAVLRALRDWGVDTSVWIPALDTPPQRIYYLTADEIKASQLATHIVSGNRELRRALR